MEVYLTSHDALLIVDPQLDFCPGGALGVPHAEEIMPVLNRYASFFVQYGARVLVSRDWHPAAHCSFKEQGGPWPVHCVEGSRGSAFHPSLRLPVGTTVINKGTESAPEAYSAFQNTGLTEMLQKSEVKRLFIGGLATDYCVKQTVLDALTTGFTVFLLLDAIRGVEVNPGDSASAVRTMLISGAVGMEFADWGSWRRR